MKKLTIFLLLLPFIALSQHKGDTKIIVSLADTTNTIQRISAVLYEHGFLIERKDEQFIYTAGRVLKQLNGKARVKVLLKGNTATFSALWNLPALDNEYETVGWNKRKGSLLRDAWDETEEIAKQFGTIQYAK